MMYLYIGINKYRPCQMDPLLLKSLHPRKDLTTPTKFSLYKSSIKTNLAQTKLPFQANQ